MSNKIYPAIYKSEDGNLYLYENRANCYSFGYKNWIGSNDNIFDTHESDKNITAEYLANTYGEVKSKEHAEFIVELAKNAGFSVVRPYKDKRRFFSFWDGQLGFFELESIATSSCAKQITIPLPNKQLATTETKDVESNIVIVDAIPTINHCVADNICSDHEFGTKESERLNNGDNLLFGGEGKCKEWPCVGDEVLSDGIKWKVAAEYKHMVMLVTDDDCVFKVAAKRDCEKPKTPEEELRDEIALDLNKMQLVSNLVKAGELMAKYNITKKPQ